MKSTGELIERQQPIHHTEISWLNGLTFLSIIIKTSCRVWSRYDGRRRASVKQLILLMMSRKDKHTDVALYLVDSQSDHTALSIQNHSLLE